MVSPEPHVVTAAQQLTMALQRNIPAGNKIAEALQNVSKLFTKIALTKNKATKAKAKCNKIQPAPVAQQTNHLPRVEAPIQK
jgi:hypothetical protein